jgi:tetratricopeptide (TPR) repeat protein
VPENFHETIIFEATHSKKSGKQRSDVGAHVAEKNINTKGTKSFSVIKPETTHSLFSRGCARLELKRYLETRKAIADFTQCMELLSPSTSPAFACELFYKRAFAYHEISRHNEAIKDYDELINRCRPIREQGKVLVLNGLIGRGKTYQAMGKLGLAFRDIDDANKMTGNTDPYCLCCRASIYASKHDYKRAVADLDKASKMGSDQNLDALLERASVLSEFGKYDVALPDLEKALTMSHENTQKAEIYYRRGMCDYALKNRDQALHSFEQAVKMNPYHGKAHFRIGMIQAEKGQLKEALRTLNKAHELAPQQRDILLERSIINRKLGNADEAADDVNRGMQLASTTVSTVTALENHIRRLREEIKHNGSSTRTHFELAIAYDGLVTQEPESDAQEENYKEAVTEYRAAIDSDTNNTYPQARALLALCQKKMNDLIGAHQWHLEFCDMFYEHREAVHHWKAYLKDINERMESSNLEPHLDESAVRKLMHMERNRKVRNIDEENYKNDTEDQYKNQLSFYMRLRYDLSDVLAAIALANLDDDTIVHNIRSTPSK